MLISYSITNHSAPELDRAACEEAKYTFAADIASRPQGPPILNYYMSASYELALSLRFRQATHKQKPKWVSPSGTTWSHRHIQCHRKVFDWYFQSSPPPESNIMMNIVTKAKIASFDQEGPEVTGYSSELSDTRGNLARLISLDGEAG